MRLLSPIFILLFFLLVSFFGLSREIEKSVLLIGNSQISVGNVLNLEDDKYNCMIGSGTGCTPLDLYKSRFITKLRYEESGLFLYTSPWVLEIGYDITLYDELGNNTPQQGTLKIDYHPTSGYTYTDLDYNVYNTQNYVKAELEITTIVQNTFPGGNLPNDVYLELVYESEQYEQMNVTHAPVVSTPLLDVSKAELTLNWPTVVGAESYDFEWLFIDIGRNPLTGGSYSYSYDFKNASRINTSTNFYTISMAYPKGFFLFRARAVQTKNTANGVQRIEGEWTTPVNTGTITNTGLLPVPYGYPLTTSHPICLNPPYCFLLQEAYGYNGLESTRNWQYSVTYAEEGKRKEAITYFDGTLRNRQQVTVSSTDDRAIVGETIYDYVGRPAVNTLPSPQEDNRGMHFYPNQNRSITSGLYGYKDFDLAGNYTDSDPMDTTSSEGSAKYYSGSSNYSVFGINSQYIPTARGYNYTRVQYKNDGTNRVKKQSGVGETFSIGEGRETVYLYGKPTQEELDRLFGNEAGYVNMYKKNAVVDPNGQASVSYIDNYGRTIATALSGDLKEDEYHEDGRKTLLEIDTRPSDFDTVKSELSFTNSPDNKGRMVVSQTLVITAPTTVKFTYSLSDSAMYNVCIGSKDCKYDYEIYITDEYGDKVPFSNGDTIRSEVGVSSVSQIQFSANFSEVGSFQIHKILSINQTKLAEYVQELSDSNSCLSIEIDSVTTCNPTCEDACWSGYVTVNPSGDTLFLDDQGSLIGTILSTGLLVPGNDYLTTANTEISLIRTKVQQCIAKCSDQTAVKTFNPCEIRYSVLKADMSPGGQYFDSYGTLGVSNGWLIHTIGNSPPQPCMNSTWDDVRNGWDDSWGDVLVKFHPEWCAYQIECCPVVSGENGCTPVSVISSNSGGICDPVVLENMVTAEMANFLGTNYSVDELFMGSTYPVSPSTYVSGSNSSIDELLDILYNTTDGVISVLGAMTSLEFKQSIKEFYLEKAKYDFIKTNCNSTGVYLGDITGKTVDGYTVRYPVNPVFENNLTPPVQSFNTGPSCLIQAQQITDQFMAAFACKDLLSPADTLTLRNQILSHATNNCNSSPVIAPMIGLNSLVLAFLNSRGYSAGCITGNWPEEQDEDCSCNNLFIFLADANQKPLKDIVTDANFATTTLAINALNGVLTPSDITNGINAGDLASWYSKCSNSPYSIGANVPSYFKCRTDSMPTDTNACVNSINQLTYYNQLIKIRAQVMDSITRYRRLFDSTCFGKIKQRESFTMEYLLQEYHYTLYYYDQAGNLIKTVSPEGVYQNNNGTVSSSLLNGTQLALVKTHRLHPSTTNFIRPTHFMVTNYRYNSLNQLTSQFTPDGDSSHFFYDPLGRLVASQNADQLFRGNNAGTNIYSYTEFDALGRMVEVGEIEHSIKLTEEIARNTDPTKGDTWEDWIDIVNYPLASNPRSQIVNTIYDFQDLTILPTTVLDQQNLRNRIATVTYDKNGDGSYESASHYTYDINGNVNALIQENTALLAVSNSSNEGHEYKRIDYEYDLVSGNVNKVSYQAGKEDEFYHKYEYDADNRLTVAYTSRNDVIWEKESKNLYYAHGPLARTELGDKQVQGQDYAYTLQGWLKTINSSTGHEERDIGQDGYNDLNAYFGRDAYGFSLHYYRGDYTSVVDNAHTNSTLASYGNGDFNNNVVDLYNGNISAMIVGLTRQDNSKASVIGNTYRYDQLNRIKEYAPYLSEDPENDHVYIENNMEPSQNVNMRYNTTYSYDGNGNINTLVRNGSEFIQDLDEPNNPYAIIGVPLEMDNFEYYYQNGGGVKTNNKLDYVFDHVDDTNYTDDLDAQSGGNYGYDKIGRLIYDAKENIDNIVWNVANKITQIVKDGGNQVIEFEYDPMGNRISKTNTVPSGITITYYVRDAQGNVMATYQESKANSTKPSEPFTLNDFHIYGSSRLGTKQEGLVLVENGAAVTGIDYTYRKLGNKRYELSNHLGNVLEVISDRKLAFGTGNDIHYFEADVVSYSDYYPFGMLMPNRHGDDGNGYRYGFQGQEMDDEVAGKGNRASYKFRMHDVRIGRFFAVDPLAYKFPYYSPYHFSSNSVIMAVELEGLESSVQANFVEASITINRDGQGRYVIDFWDANKNWRKNHYNDYKSNIFTVRRANLSNTSQARTDFSPGKEIDVWCSDCGKSGQWYTVTLPRFSVTREIDVEETREVTVEATDPVYEDISDSKTDNGNARLVRDPSGAMIPSAYTNADASSNASLTKNRSVGYVDGLGLKDVSFTSVSLTLPTGLDVSKYKAEFEKEFGVTVNVSTDASMSSNNYSVQYNFTGKKLISEGTPEHTETETVTVKKTIVVNPVVETP